MGVLTAAGGRGSAEPGEETPTVEAPVEEGQTRADDGTFAPAGEQPPLSRRERARREVEETVRSHLTEYEKRQAAERQQYEQRLREADQRWQQSQENLARMQGALEEMRSRPAPVAAPVQQGPDPDDLRREGRKALANNDIETYERNFAQAARIEARREAEGVFKPQLEAFKAEMEKKVQPGLPAHIQVLLMAHKNVAMAGQSGEAAVVAEKRRLDVYRRDLSEQQRMEMAFGLADKALAAGQQQQRPQGFDQGAAAALSGVTPSRNGAGGGGGGGGDPADVRLTPEQESAYRAGRFKSKAEYLKWQDPHKHGLAK